jgi:triacylglycerol lipase
MGARLELAIAILNGAIGQHLARRDNGLGTRMSLVAGGAPLSCQAAALAAALPRPTGKAVVLVHGLMSTGSVWLMAGGGDYGSLLARGLDYTPLYVRYNSGLPVADNGAGLAAVLDALVAAYPGPLDELTLIGHSMGGLVVRSALHAGALAGQRWPARVRRAFYLGTPHRGAPLERVGRGVARVLGAIDDPYTRLIAQVGDLRSDGIKDLGDRHPAALAAGVAHHLIAGTVASARLLAAVLGDGLVPLPSAIDGAPPERIAILPGVGHLALAHHPAVYDRIRAWCAEAA